jgi:molybdopterin-guanine dinucleotide biosynthesis protein A
VAARLAAGDRPMVSFLPDVRVRTIQSDELRRIDPALQSFFNINTPEDWRAAGQILDDEVAGGV